ncbi:MAG: L-threonylcarbamoyladenylate synthase [Clostridia bacterium]|nr:L-threonylcarbamoyladenylate synthase [Clostridia bacterium]
MITELVKIDDPFDAKSKEIIKRAARIILSGGLVVMPTETVYGLGGNGLDASAAKKIYAAKGRPSDNPLIIHIADPSDAEKYCHVNDTYFSLAKAFMPGPLTVILPKKDIIPMSVTGGLDTVAVRCPDHKVANAFIREAGVPIAAPSANISGRPSPTNADYVREDMDGKVDMIIDGGECEIGLESTIVKVNDDGSLILLRPGAVTYDALSIVCDKIEIASAVSDMIGENEKPLSPGMKYRHYAPSCPLVLLDGDDTAQIEFLKKESSEKKCAVLCYDEEIPFLSEASLHPIGKKDDLVSHAHNLFTILRDADKSGCDIIYAHLPPMDGLGLALYNRMIRAASHTIKKV